jgi:hypothetical protein
VARPLRPATTSRPSIIPIKVYSFALFDPTGGGRGVDGGEGKKAPTGSKRRDVARDDGNVGGYDGYLGARRVVPMRTNRHA